MKPYFRCVTPYRFLALVTCDKSGDLCLFHQNVCQKIYISHPLCELEINAVWVQILVTVPILCSKIRCRLLHMKFLYSSLGSIFAHKEKTHEIYFQYAQRFLVCGHIVSKCIEILQIFVRMEENP